VGQSGRNLVLHRPPESASAIPATDAQGLRTGPAGADPTLLLAAFRVQRVRAVRRLLGLLCIQTCSAALPRHECGKAARHLVQALVNPTRVRIVGTTAAAAATPGVNGRVHFLQGLTVIGPALQAQLRAAFFGLVGSFVKRIGVADASHSDRLVLQQLCCLDFERADLAALDKAGAIETLLPLLEPSFNGSTFAVRFGSWTVIRLLAYSLSASSAGSSTHNRLFGLLIKQLLGAAKTRAVAATKLVAELKQQNASAAAASGSGGSFTPDVARSFDVVAEDVPNADAAARKFREMTDLYFAKFDTNKDGAVTKKEALGVLQLITTIAKQTHSAHGGEFKNELALTANEMYQQISTVLDLNGDERIEKSEIYVFVDMLRPEVRRVIIIIIIAMFTY
jgi:hypothetical protein